MATRPLPGPLPDRILRMTDLPDKVGLGRTNIYQRIRTGEFPRPVDLGGGRVGWKESDLDQWIADRDYVTSA